MITFAKFYVIAYCQVYTRIVHICFSDIHPDPTTCSRGGDGKHCNLSGIKKNTVTIFIDLGLLDIASNDKPDNANKTLLFFSIVE